VSAELVDPFATHEPALTPEEWQDIRDEVSEAPWLDPARFPELVTEALKVLGDLGLSGDPFTRRTATQALRRMAYRAKTGAFPNEPREPAWSLDAEREVKR
jgi:hypothetical protein